MDVHNDTMAVAYVTPNHGPAGVYLGTIGARQIWLLKQEPFKSKT
jgi:hypothetical protein